MKETFLLIGIILLSLFSCQKDNIDNIEEENTCQIISFLMNDSKKHVVLPPTLSFPPDAKLEITSKDSLLSYKYHYEQLTKKKVIAIESNLFGIREEYNFRDKCEIDQDLLDLFNSQKEERKIDISKITDFNKDSIIEYKEEFSKLPLRGFKKMDLLLNFSRIAFNKEYNKALVIIGVTKGHLNGHSSIIYLEKENYYWKIKCSRVLEIS